MVAVAVKVTRAPGQKGLAEADIETPAGKPVFSIMVIELDVTGLLIGHEILEFRSQVTTSLLLGTYVYVELFDPAFVPLTFHW